MNKDKVNFMNFTNVVLEGCCVALDCARVSALHVKCTMGQTIMIYCSQCGAGIVYSLIWGIRGIQKGG